MKIGIVTLHLLGNYGAILQNYAMQQTLKKLGHDPITLDYLPGYSGLNYCYRALRRLGSIILRRNSEFITYAPKRKNKAIDSFISEFLSTTRPFWNGYSPRLIDSYRLEAIVVGSDQVWRPVYARRLLDMYGRFCRKSSIPRIAYAASFGTDKFEYTPDQAQRCAKLLSDFRAVSVREKSGLQLLEKLGRNDGVQVIDPTILLGREGFENLLSAAPDLIARSVDNYLGAYLLDADHAETETLERLRRDLQLNEIVRFSEDEEQLGPREWIDTIRNSRFFVTDSFHGTIFCLLFHVPFATIVNSSRGADRFISLLQPLGLSDRMVRQIADIKSQMPDIDWAVVDSRLEIQREEALKFLLENLS